ncbi:MAG: hypothetical protein HQM16_02650 [Deltaproteobacteria bacterium]|nr:hypothetical protein [Deltaproteobacteria bacterium]
MKRLFYILIMTMLCLVTTPSAQAKVVASDWEFLDDYQRLIACGAVKRPFFGQRLWTTREIAREIRAIDRENIKSRCTQEFVAETIRRLSPLITREESVLSNKHRLSLNPVESVSAGYRLMPGGDSVFQAGGTDAVINTFREYEQGRVFGVGHQFSVQTEHELSWLKQQLVVLPRFDVLVHNEFNNVDDYRLTLQEAYLLFDLWKLTILAGRAPVVWGQAEHGGFIFGENVRPLDHIQLTPTEAFRFPWFFKYIGDLKFSLIFGTLGPEQRYPWPFFTGLTLGFKPLKFIELNMSHVFEFGGNGAEKLGVETFIREFFGFIPHIASTSPRGSNKMSEINGRFFIPPLMGTEIYLSYFMDDANTGSTRAFKKHFLHNSSYQAGVVFTCFLFSCHDELRLEYTNSSPISYRHTEFNNGWVVNHNIVADPLGSNGNRFLVSWKREWDRKYMTGLTARFASRENKQYGVGTDILDVTTTFDGPAEKRYSIISQHHIRLRHPISLKLDLGYEYISNYQSVPSRTKNSCLLSAEMQYKFR